MEPPSDTSSNYDQIYSGGGGILFDDCARIEEFTVFGGIHTLLGISLDSTLAFSIKPSKKHDLRTYQGTGKYSSPRSIACFKAAVQDSQPLRTGGAGGLATYRESSGD
jgi:hypothetical protein